MLNPETVVSALVDALQSITPLVVALGDENRIVGFVYAQGDQLPLSKMVYEVQAPGVLVCWKGIIGGDFDGMTIWKHQIDVYIRSANMAGATPTTGPGYLWWLICNKPVNIPSYSSALNIRNTQVLPGQLDLMETPSISHRQDEDGLDYFVGSMIFPEIGDQ